MIPVKPWPDFTIVRLRYSTGTSRWDIAQYNLASTGCTLQVENILLSDKGHYVLCDFGSATAR